jgi:hypothetical protein
MSIDRIRNDWIASPLDIITTFQSISAATVLAASVSAITGASSGSQYNVCKRVTITCAATSGCTQPPVQFQLFNSSNSAGTALAGWVLNPQNAVTGSGTIGVTQLDLDNLHIATPSAAQAMCVSNITNTANGGLYTINLQTYVLGRQPKAVTIVS